MSRADRERAARLRAQADKIAAAIDGPDGIAANLERAAAIIQKLRQWCLAARENADLLERAP